MKLRSGDDNTFRDVYEQSFSLLIKIAYHITFNTDVAEDICQDTFIRFYNKDICFPSYDEAKYWLIRVTKNLAINYVKKGAKEVSAFDRVEKYSYPENSFSDGASELLLSESRQKVRKAIVRLPEIYRTVVVLKEYGNLNYKEISKILRISESNVKVRVHRARKELEVLLDEREDNYVS